MSGQISGAPRGHEVGLIVRDILFILDFEWGACFPECVFLFDFNVRINLILILVFTDDLIVI